MTKVSHLVRLYSSVVRRFISKPYLLLKQTLGIATTWIGRLYWTLRSGVLKVTQLLRQGGAAIGRLRMYRSFFRFAHNFSAQLCIGFLVFSFLLVSVDEGRAYSSIDLAGASLALSADSNYIGKPRVVTDQTILTGEVSQNVFIIYQVEAGDSLVSIAKRYDLSVGTILEANNMDPVKSQKIQPGDKIVIPSRDTDTSLAWLDKINQAKAEEEARIAAEQRKRLATSRRLSQRLASRQVVSANSSGYSVVGSIRGGSGQCVWYAHYKRPDLPSVMGNARDFLANAKAYGLKYGSSPRVGAVIQTKESRWGHVGIVESVSGGSITISDMNYAGPHIVTRRTLSTSDSTIVGYIY